MAKVKRHRYSTKNLSKQTREKISRKIKHFKEKEGYEHERAVAAGINYVLSKKAKKSKKPKKKGGR